MYEFIVSCVIINKYVYMLCGIYEFKFFFNFLIIKYGGEDFVSEVVKVKICDIIGEENFKKLFLDVKIVKIFVEEDIDIVC